MALTGLSALSGLSAQFGGGLTLTDRMAATSPIAWWIQNEGVGLTAVDQINSPAQDGTYTGVSWPPPAAPGPDGQVTPYFDGVNDFNDIFTAAFAAALDGGEGSVAAWVKLSAWDAALRTILNIRVDANNRISLLKFDATDIRFTYVAGGVAEDTDHPSATLDWFHVAMTWSAIADQVIAYFNGVQTGVIRTVLGVWAGVPIATSTVIGAFSTIPGNVLDGWIAHPAAWDRPLIPAEVLSIGVAA